MIDVNDLNKLDCEKARKALDSMDDYARMAGITPIGPLFYLEDFIEKIESLQRKYTKPIAALLKKD